MSLQGNQKNEMLNKQQNLNPPPTLHLFSPRWNSNFFNGSMEEKIQKRNSKTEEKNDSIEFERPGEYSKTCKQYVVTDNDNVIISPNQLRGYVYDDAMVRSWLKNHPDQATFKPGWVNF